MPTAGTVQALPPSDNNSRDRARGAGAREREAERMQQSSRGMRRAGTVAVSVVARDATSLSPSPACLCAFYSLASPPLFPRPNPATRPVCRAPRTRPGVLVPSRVRTRAPSALAFFSFTSTASLSSAAGLVTLDSTGGLVSRPSACLLCFLTLMPALLM